MKNDAQVLESKLGSAEGENSLLQKQQGAMRQTEADLQRQVGNHVDRRLLHTLRASTCFSDTVCHCSFQVIHAVDLIAGKLPHL